MTNSFVANISPFCLTRESWKPRPFFSFPLKRGFPLSTTSSPGDRFWGKELTFDAMASFSVPSVPPLVVSISTQLFAPLCVGDMMIFLCSSRPCSSLRPLPAFPSLRVFFWSWNFGTSTAPLPPPDGEESAQKPHRFPR